MHFKAVSIHDWPETDDGSNALSREQILALYGGATPRLLVDVSDSNLLKCVPSLDYVLHDLDGEEVFNTFIELHVIEFYYSCICSLGDDCYSLDLTRAIAPWALDRVEAHLAANGFDYSETTEGIFKQRLRLFALDPAIEPVVLSLDDFVYLEPDGVTPPVAPAQVGARRAAPAAPPQFVPDPQNKMWPLRIKFMDLIMAGKLAPYGDLAALLGKRLRREERLRPGGQFQMAVAVLKAWSMAYDIDDPDVLGVLLAQKIKIDVPPEIANGNVRHPAIFDDELTARTRWASLDQRGMLLAERMATLLARLPTLRPRSRRTRTTSSDVVHIAS